MKRIFLTALLILILLPLGHGNEVIEDTKTKVAVHNHPRTGQPFVSITAEDAAQSPFSETKLVKRPDYRMLDPKVKPKDVGYEGPVSDRKKVYILAASLATVGTVGGVSIIAAAPAATGAGAAGGAGIYGAAGTAVVAGTAAGTIHATHTDPEKINFKQTSEAHAVGTSNTGLAKPESSGKIDNTQKEAA